MLDFTYKEILWAISVLILLYGTIVYIVSIIQWKSHPHIYTWIIWTILLAIAFLWQISDAAWPWAWANGLASFSALIIVLFSLKYGKKDINKFDTFLLISALIAIWVYLSLDNITYAIILVIIIDLVWYLPTIRKSIKLPYSEDLFFWNIMTFRMLLSLGALNHFSFLAAWYQLALFIANIITILILLYFRRKVPNPNLK